MASSPPHTLERDYMVLCIKHIIIIITTTTTTTTTTTITSTVLMFGDMRKTINTFGAYLNRNMPSCI